MLHANGGHYYTARMQRSVITSSAAVLAAAALALTVSVRAGAQSAEAPFLRSELIFPLEHWHNHGSMIVELPDGDLLTCWFHGSGERTADDVVVRGARLRKGE